MYVACFFNLCYTFSYDLYFGSSPGVPISALDGVPIAVKDEIDCRPYPTTGNLSVFEMQLPVIYNGGFPLTELFMHVNALFIFRYYNYQFLNRKTGFFRWYKVASQIKTLYR